jgi:sulfur carrier protein ThiS
MNIDVTLRFFSGIDKEINIKNYDPSMGLTLSVSKGTRLKKILKKLEMPKMSSNAYFREGERMGLWSKVRDGDDISVLRPSGGG